MDESEQRTDDIRCLFFIVINILTQTSPQLLYTQIDNPYIELYNTIFENVNSTTVSSYLADLKQELLGIL
jgi:hypothetical protein